jgi:hypothetical protein
MTGLTTLPVVVESGKKRVFGSVLDWPGWCRSARTEEAALDALATYAPRYAAVVTAAGLTPPDLDGFAVVERATGNTTTDFGAPSVPARAELADLSAADAERLAALMEAGWERLAELGRTAPRSLRKGPRGGGRDRDAVIQHVLSAEAAYARKAGLRLVAPDAADGLAVAAFHEELAGLVRRSRLGGPSTDNGWPIRYAVRRVVWHVLDHVWEIEDRSR